MSEPQSETAALAAALGKTTEASLTLKGQQFSIQPVQVDQILQMMLCIDRLADKGLKLPGINAFTTDTSPTAIIQLLLRSGDDFKDFLAIAANPDLSQKAATITFIGSLNLLELAQYAGLVWKVNKDFFVENQTAILAAFGLDQNKIAGLTNLVGSIKSLLTSAPPESQTSEPSPSEKSTPSPAPSADNNANS